MFLVYTVAFPKEIQDYYTNLNVGNSVYHVIGTMKLQTASLTNFLIMVGSVFVYPLAAGIIRWRILKHLEHHLNNFSAHNKAQHRSFVKGLTIQSVLPFLTYFPTFAMYVFIVLTRTEILFQQYFIYIMPTFPAFFDPFVTLYFVVPYRKTWQRWLGIEKDIQVAPSSVSANITTVQ
ncbi:CBN-SRD-39 protein [Caenorhabditis brenneri]|uniref:CBN-SRD-39 protein n=1 Tax=Caenorhabditis brenneri TaxID=135651 RepID=G0MBI0_CAEBE|nr:CBN-SRD-39 protein [Caenorhabditis brenneri]